MASAQRKKVRFPRELLLLLGTRASNVGTFVSVRCGWQKVKGKLLYAATRAQVVVFFFFAANLPPTPYALHTCNKRFSRSNMDEKKAGRGRLCQNKKGSHARRMDGPSLRGTAASGQVLRGGRQPARGRLSLYFSTSLYFSLFLFVSPYVSVSLCPLFLFLIMLHS